jgi:hypothetical protein
MSIEFYTSPPIARLDETTTLLARAIRRDEGAISCPATAKKTLHWIIGDDWHCHIEISKMSSTHLIRSHFESLLWKASVRVIFIPIDPWTFETGLKKTGINATPQHFGNPVGAGLLQ